MSKLSEPQRELLAEMVDSSTGGLYIHTGKRYARTARALEDRGLVEREGWAQWGQQLYVPTAAGRVLITELRASTGGDEG